MTKEELEEEAEEWLCNNLHFASEEDFIEAMVAIAEPREKRIAELEAYNEKLLNGDIEKHNKIVELEKSIQKKKFIIDQLNVQLEELEKENAELKRIVRMVAMINKGIYTEEGIKSIYAEAEAFLKEE